MLGLLLINKPEGITSFGAVARIRRLTGERRVGHTGTLDPMATGILPILIGRGTSLSSYLLSSDKGYTARIRLGIETDTCDITGSVVKTAEVGCRNQEVVNILGRFIGKQSQIPPMYSAIKRDGVRMYELARRGEQVEIPARDIEVFSLKQTSALDDNFEFTVETEVSKGTYIRSLCRDIGSALGCGATLTALTRTKVAGFKLCDCVNLDELTTENINKFILPAERAVAHLPKIAVTEKQAIRFSNGGSLSFDRLKVSEFQEDEIFRVCYGEQFLGLGRADTESGQIKTVCIIESFR